MKTCPQCGAIDGFGKNKARPDGLSVYCKACARKYNNTYYDRTISKHRPPGDRPSYMRRKNVTHKELINPLKDVPCMDCSKKFAAPCMEFDHVRPGKRNNVSAMNSCATETVLAEIEKCEPVCANCHRVRTALRRPAPKLPDADLPTWKRNKALKQLEKIASFRSWVLVLKQAPCTDCREIFHPAAMDFDHVRGEKLLSISNGWQFTQLEVLAELAKTELVCACCHRLRTETRCGQKAA
jgi:5-methylcytosine-specific restriction endonuclease McrA